MILAHKIRIYPTDDQKVLLSKAFGVSRYTYNWALNEWNEQYKLGQKPKYLELKKQWNQIKPNWVYESPKDANQQPFVNLNSAFQRFFKKLGKYPRFKKKGNKESFYISNDKFWIKDEIVKLPKIGLVKLSESLRFEGKILSGVVSKRADQYFISIQVKIENHSKKHKSNKVIGIDVGISNAITTSDNQQFQAPKPFKNQREKIARLNRRLARKKKFSNNWHKHKTKLQRAYLTLSNIRQDFWNKVTTTLCHENQVICVEDLNVKGMIKNRKLSFSLADVGLGEFFRQLEYKKEIFGNIIQKIDRWFPSSQLCSNCGNKQKLSLSQRIYNCPQCGIVIDRDLNAAKNICTEGYSGTSQNSENACGQLTSYYLSN